MQELIIVIYLIETKKRKMDWIIKRI